MRKLIILTAALALPLLASSQMRILPNGHIVAGYDGTETKVMPSGIVVNCKLVPDTTRAMTIATSEFQNKGGHISFGSYGNVLVGESSAVDDRLDLYATQGLTYRTQGGTVFSHKTTLNNTNGNFIFSIPVSASQYLTNSDARLKSDIRNLEGRGEGLFSLTPVSYKLAVGPCTYQDTAEQAETMGQTEITGASLENQKLAKIAEAPTVDEYGFIAQEVREIFPELVVEREDGILMVDYQGMIPLLVDALSTLRDKVAQQEKVIATLTGEESGRRLAPTASSSSLTLSGTSMSQNRPNPTSGMTVIDLSVAEDVAQAFVAFYDLTGRQLKRYDIAERGKSTLTISDGEFVPGIYVYALVADGEEVQTRRMVVSE